MKITEVSRRHLEAPYYGRGLIAEFRARPSAFLKLIRHYAPSARFTEAASLDCETRVTTVTAAGHARKNFVSSSSLDKQRYPPSYAMVQFVKVKVYGHILNPGHPSQNLLPIFDLNIPFNPYFDSIGLLVLPRRPL